MRHRISRDRLGFLRRIRVFGGCSTAELARIDSLCDETTVAPGRVLTREGCLGRESFVIVRGSAEVTIRGRRVAMLGPGDVFGEMALLSRDRLRVATVTALEPMELLVIDPRRFACLLEIESVGAAVKLGALQRRSSVELVTA